MEDKIVFQDIIGFTEVQIDSSGYLFALVYFVVVSTVVLYILIYLKSKKRTTKRKKTPFQKLQEIDFKKDDSKSILYHFTINAKLLRKETNKKELQEILELIEPLKYQKEDVIIDNNIKSKLQRYINGLVK